MRIAATARILSKTPVILLLHVLSAAAMLVLLRPMVDRSMGPLLRWIAVHAAMTQAALFLLGLLSLTALLSWYVMKARLYALLKTMMTAVTLLWILNYGLMLYVTLISWGGFDWQEPRMLVSTQLLFILLPWFGLNILIDFPWLIRYTSFALGIFSQFLIRSAPVVNHPLDPVAAGGEASLAFGFSALTVLFTVLAVYDLFLVDRKVNGEMYGG